MNYFSSDIIPIGTLVLGWALNELHHVIMVQQEHVSSVRRALAYLLEVRFQLQAFELVIVEIKRRSPEAETFMPQFRSLLETVIGNENQINEKYEEAIQVIAGRDPFLAYELMSRNKISTFFQNWRNMALSAGTSGEELEQAESHLRELIGPKFDENILSIAGKLSWRTKWRTKRVLSKPLILPMEMSTFLDRHIPEQNPEQPE